MSGILPLRDAAAVRREKRRAVDPEVLAAAGRIVEDVRRRGAAALTEHALRLGDLRAGETWWRPREELQAALESLDPRTRAVLERVAARVEDFARAQRGCLVDLRVPLPGGEAGHEIAPMERAGCYAPGGRFPLPSSVLMTAVTARVAGVASVVVASPRPAVQTLAAAAVAGADGLLAVGGAQAVAALALGVEGLDPVDVVVGPGNAWVTAAKKWVAGEVAIDMLAGPSELVVVADGACDAELVAADLLAQAEHDPQALPILVALEPELCAAVRAAAERQLAGLPTAATARRALTRGFCVVAGSSEEAAVLCDRLAPEHLQLSVAEPRAMARRLRHWGALFVGERAAEVLGDYGAGPNHVLPTGGTARFSGGLSVLHFLRVRTWMDLGGGGADAVVDDAVALARMEGLEAHARAAARRRG